VKGAEMIAIDELMCANHSRTMSTGELPNTSFIKRMPERFVFVFCLSFNFLKKNSIYFFISLGTEFKVAACLRTGCLLYLALQG